MNRIFLKKKKKKLEQEKNTFLWTFYKFAVHSTRIHVKMMNENDG